MADLGERRRSVTIRYFNDFPTETKHSFYTRVSLFFQKIFYAILHPIRKVTGSSKVLRYRSFIESICSSFMARFVQQLYKCKPVGVVGAEQLLLDTHMLKTALLDLPSVGSQVARKPPASYSKTVIKGMTRAEMILKVVMDASDTNMKYVTHYMRLLPDSDQGEFQKILDMKGVRRADQQQLVDLYRAQVVNSSDREDSAAHLNSAITSNPNILGYSTSPDHESSRIKKLEKLIKRRL